jgi:hypothetical protein
MGRHVDEIMRARVLIAGGGVAGLETLLALRALAADRVETTILAPELKFAIPGEAALDPGASIGDGSFGELSDLPRR